MQYLPEMSNTRRVSAPKPSLREAMRENAHLREMVKFQSDEIERLNGLLNSPILARPDDLEDWINEVALGDLSDSERAEWDAMSDDERERFVDALGQRLATVENLPA